MPRYFKSIVTGRPLNVGGRSFVFEPVEPMGGSWSGVLAVEDDSAASILAANGQSVWEITAEQFDALKKKRSGAATPPGLKSSLTPQLPPQPLVLGASRAASAPTNSRSELPAAAAADAPIAASVELLTTTKQPPPEPLLDTPAPKRRKAA